MTHNQIEYWKLQETKRNNLATEQETRRHNVVGEGETNRSNIAKEVISAGTLAENTRHNRASESETYRHNAAAENETTRSNRAREAETWRSNLAREIENFRSNKARERENYRSNREKERLTERGQSIEDSHYRRSDENEAKLTDLKSWDTVFGGANTFSKALESGTKAADILSKNGSLASLFSKVKSGFPIVIDQLMPNLVTPGRTGYRTNDRYTAG